MDCFFSLVLLILFHSFRLFLRVLFRLSSAFLVGTLVCLSSCRYPSNSSHQASGNPLLWGGAFMMYRTGNAECRVDAAPGVLAVFNCSFCSHLLQVFSGFGCFLVVL